MEAGGLIGRIYFSSVIVDIDVSGWKGRRDT
jgi:hypothetical protein